MWLQSLVIEMLLDNDEEIVYEEYDSASAFIQPQSVSINIVYSTASPDPSLAE